MSFNQICAVTNINLRSIPQRMITSLVIVIGIAGVVAVLISVLAMSSGMIKSMDRAGSEDRVIVVRNGSASESTSVLSASQAQTILNAPRIKIDTKDMPIASKEIVTLAQSIKRDGSRISIPIRGVGIGAFVLRDEIKLIDGRLFEPGLNELIVGKSAYAQYGGLALGASLSFRNSTWKVVGIFESNGSTIESELMTNSDTLLSAMRRDQYSSVTVQLDSNNGDAFKEFVEAITTDPNLTVDVYKEKDFLELQSKSLSQLFSIIAYVIGGIMAVGAIFAALNTMYSAVSNRADEIATLRALGYHSLPIVVSVLVESMGLALIGAVIGALIAWFAFNGYSVSSTTSMGAGLGSGTPESRVFSLDVNASLILLGILWGWAIGLVGGLLPAIRAVRMSVATALREV